MERQNRGTLGKMVGIIPLDGYEYDEKLPYAPWLKPLVENLTLAENAVLQCAFLGCKQIIIVCEERSARMLKRHLGEWVEDPKRYFNSFVDFPNDYKVQIPIYYTRIPEKDRRQRGSASWAIIHGANFANSMSQRLSKWSMARNFFVTFPWTATDFWEMKNKAFEATRKDESYFSYEGKSIWDGEYLPFIFNQKSFAKMRANFHEQNTLVWKTVAPYKSQEKWLERLPKEEQYSGRHFPIDKLVQPVVKEEIREIPLEMYFNAFTWEGYSKAVGTYTYRRPKSLYLQQKGGNRRLERIGVEEDE